MADIADRVVWEFRKEQVLAKDFTEFLSLFANPLNKGLPPQSQGSFSICVGGYDDDDRELAEIQEVREFYAEFLRVWPYWLFFVNSDFLLTMVYCILPTFAMRRDEALDVIVYHIDDEEILDFVEKQTPNFIRLAEIEGLDALETNEALVAARDALLPQK